MYTARTSPCLPRLALLAAIVSGVILATPDTHAAPRKERMRVAVMDFTNAAGDDLAHLGKGLQSMLTTDLAEVEDFELVERARLSDIRAELDLSQSKLIDKKTAVRIGKLSGASHLIVGTYTVVGDRMRIDTRMFAAESGTIMLTAKVDGRKDDFFELEKDLVKQLVGATGATLSSRERARLGKIHTADFQAFEKFSQGIDLFDAQRYDDAIQAMRQASTIDAEFDLARLTLAEYERLASNMRTRADAAGVAEAELARLREDKDRRREAAVVERLFALASRKGAQHHRERVLALALLLEIYTGNYRGWEFLRRLEETGDKFAITRTREWLRASYRAEVSEYLGELPPFGMLVQMPPTTVDEIDKVFAAMRKSMQEHLPGLSLGLNGDVHSLARSLHLDRSQEAALLETMVRYGLDHTKDDGRHTRWLLELAELYQDALELDKSTRQLVLLGRMTKEAKVLDEAAERMAENRDLKALLEQRGPLQPYVREYLMNSISKPKLHPIRRARELFVGKDFTDKMAREIDHERQWYDDDYMLLADQPMWALQGSREVRTGPRKDRYRTDEIRYYVSAKDRSDHGGLLGVWGARPQGDFRARFRARYTAPRDYWLAQHGEERDELSQGRAAHARVSFLFGLRNIETKLERDEKTRTSRYPAPMTGYAVHIEADTLVVARVRAEPAARGGSHRELVSEVVQRIRLDTRSLAELDVVVEVKKDRVTVQAGGKSTTVALPGYESGYLGVKIDGHGYAAWNAVSLNAGGQGKTLR